MMKSEPDFPGQRFQVDTTEMVGVSPEAQVKYLMQVIKVKDDLIATLKMELKTLTLSRGLEELHLERRLDAFTRAADEMRGIKQARIPVEAVAWLEWKMLPWWKRIFRRKTAWQK